MLLFHAQFLPDAFVVFVADLFRTSHSGLESPLCESDAAQKCSFSVFTVANDLNVVSRRRSIISSLLSVFFTLPSSLFVTFCGGNWLNELIHVKVQELICCCVNSPVISEVDGRVNFSSFRCFSSVGAVLEEAGAQWQTCEDLKCHHDGGRKWAH